MSPIPISPDDIAEMREEREKGQINDDPMLLYPILKQAHDEKVAREYQLVCRIADLQKERDELQQQLAETKDAYEVAENFYRETDKELHKVETERDELQRQLENAREALTELDALHDEGKCVYDNEVGVAVGKLAAALAGGEGE